MGELYDSIYLKTWQSSYQNEKGASILLLMSIWKNHVEEIKSELIKEQKEGIIFVGKESDGRIIKQ